MNPKKRASDDHRKYTQGRISPELKAQLKEEAEVPRPSILSTLVLLAGVFFTISTLRGTSSSAIAAYAAWGIGLSLTISVLIDLQNGIRNLIRTDVMALFALYFLTLFEFLLPQTNFDGILAPTSVRAGCIACGWGYAGLAIGRHLSFMGAGHFSQLFERPVTPAFIMRLFWFCAIIGYFYMLMSVNFNPYKMVVEFMEPRFSQSWGRGRFGDWRALLSELSLLIYVIPAISGVILAKRHLYTKSQLIQVSFLFGFTLFYGFSGGTRNVFASYLVTFLIGYAFSMPKHRTTHLLVVTAVAAIMLLVATRVMLEFRNIGLRHYFDGITTEEEQSEKEFFVDYNLFVICQLTEIFPKRFNYMGWEIPYLAVIRPIPRALWPGKPEGMSVSFEEALGVEGLTLASSFVGEAYVTQGNVGVFFTALFFGIVFGWWSCLASPRNSDFGILIYASGFFAAVISMRSMFVFTTAVLPTVAALMSGQFLVNIRKKPNLSLDGRKSSEPGDP